MRPHRIVLCAFVVATILLSACGSSDDSANDPCAGDKEDSVSTSSTAIPDCFPLEVADGGSVVESVVATNDGVSNYQLTLSYPDGQFDALVGHYGEQAQRFTDAETEVTTDPDGTRNHLITSEAAQAIIGITQPPDQPVLVLMFLSDLEKP